MSASRDTAVLARFGFRAPEIAIRELPEGWSADERWTRLLEVVGEVTDPDAALRRLRTLGQDVLEPVLEAPDVARPLLHLLGFSEYLTQILARVPGLSGDILAGTERDRTDLREFKDAGLVRIAAHDLSQPPTKESFVEAGSGLATLADGCLDRVLEELGSGSEMAVMAMGKHGGRELNYASDIDVLFVFRSGDHDHAEQIARELMRQMNGPPTIFRTDANLRPEGRDGPLARSLDAYASYYKRWAQVWEYQALIKCRFAAGDAELGAEFLDLVRPFVWPERMQDGAIEQVRALKARAEQEVSRRGLQGRQVKLGSGGIRDVEFAVQLLQLVHGRHHPEIRSANTLEALDILGSEGFVAEEDARELARAYVFLRHAEHRLQLERGRQTHTLPRGPARREHLARGLGFRDTPHGSALDAFEAEWRHTTRVVRHLHERLFYRPLLEAFAGTPAVGPTLPTDEARERLSALGFDRPPRVQEGIERMTAGSSRRAKVMRAILPGLLAWLAETPDPDAGIQRLADLTRSLDSMPHLLAVLRDEPPVADLVCRAVGTGPVLAGLLEREPSLIGTLRAEEQPAERGAVIREATAIVTRAGDQAEAIVALRRFKEGEWLQLACQDLAAGNDPAVFVDRAHRLSDIADACLEAALTLARVEIDERTGGPPPGGLAVIGMGRLGGRELSYASDLDVLFVYDEKGDDGHCPDGTEARDYYTTLAERVIAILGTTPPIFKVDAELRPEGKDGPLVRSLGSYVQYYERWASLWEFQALLRARHAAGDESVTDRLLEAAAPKVWREELTAEEIAEIRRMKARIERERVKARQDPRQQVKLGVGGLADIEFTVQLQQMVHGHAHPAVRTPNTLQALEALRNAGVVGGRDLVWLRDAYLMLNRIRNHMFLLRGLATDALPTKDEEVERLARSLGHGRLSRSRFLEDYRRITRRARQVCDRLFYGEEEE